MTHWRGQMRKALDFWRRLFRARPRPVGTDGASRETQNESVRPLLDEDGIGTSVPQYPVNRFWRLEPQRDPTKMPGKMLTPPIASPDLLGRVRPGDGIVFATWDAAALLGRVSALGIVTEVRDREQTIAVDWRAVEKSLTPSPQGRAQWVKRPCFLFDAKVANRYELASLFRRAFTDADG